MEHDATKTSIIHHPSFSLHLSSFIHIRSVSSVLYGLPRFSFQRSKLVIEEIVVVSGLPRSGTSLMMQMLDRGGIDVVTDRVRTADTDNPHGYFEFEAVKRINQDASWLPGTRGKAFKAVSQLLYDLPSTERYRIIFMQRDLDELLRSQEKMLVRLGRTPAPADSMKQSYVIHLERLGDWLAKQDNMKVLFVRYHDLISDPEPQAARINCFLGETCNVAWMISAIDPALYRNRSVIGGDHGTVARSVTADPGVQ
jgi:hypothetical protein